MTGRLSSRLVVISGLPGVGKTSVATIAAARLGAMHLSIDASEESILACGLPPGRQVGVGAYESVRAMAELNLRLGHDVVVDAVNDSEAARQTWRNACVETSAELTFVMLVISDVQVHQRRLVGRDRGFVQVPEPLWGQVQARAKHFAPWTDKHLEFDTAARPIGATVDALLAHLTEI